MADLARERAVDVVSDPDELGDPPDVLLPQDAVLAYELAERFPGVPPGLRQPQRDVRPPAAAARAGRGRRRGGDERTLPGPRGCPRRRRTGRPAPAAGRHRAPGPAGRPGTRSPDAPCCWATTCPGRAGGSSRRPGRRWGSRSSRWAWGRDRRSIPRTTSPQADIVVGKARAVLDAMSCGRPAYVYDAFGADGWVTADSLRRHRGRRPRGSGLPRCHRPGPAAEGPGVVRPGDGTRQPQPGPQAPPGAHPRPAAGQALRRGRTPGRPRGSRHGGARARPADAAALAGGGGADRAPRVVRGPPATPRRRARGRAAGPPSPHTRSAWTRRSRWRASRTSSGWRGRTGSGSTRTSSPSARAIVRRPGAATGRASPLPGLQGRSRRAGGQSVGPSRPGAATGPSPRTLAPRDGPVASTRAPYLLVAPGVTIPDDAVIGAHVVIRAGVVLGRRRRHRGLGDAGQGAGAVGRLGEPAARRRPRRHVGDGAIIGSHAVLSVGCQIGTGRVRRRPDLRPRGRPSLGRGRGRRPRGARVGAATRRSARGAARRASAASAIGVAIEEDCFLGAGGDHAVWHEHERPQGRRAVA